MSVLDADIPDDPYMNYLQWPHFHFSGTFISDISTVNNDPFNYDTERFVQADQLPNEVKGNPSYNPRGSGEWSVNGSVTHVCYANGTCVGDDKGNKDTEPLMAAPILGTYAIYAVVKRGPHRIMVKQSLF